jgi:carbamoyl-phosphate synthase small subunit
VDTRALTRRIRIHGALRGVISTELDNDVELVRRAQTAASMAGANLVPQVASKEIGAWCRPLVRLEAVDVRKWGSGTAGQGNLELVSQIPFAPAPLATPPPAAGCHIVALDCGIKHNILRRLRQQGFRVRVLPAATPATEALAHDPDGIFLSNGPGDPEVLTYAHQAVRDLLGKKPLFGICLGHQILSFALGGRTFKLKFGHRGGNQPVKDLATGAVAITSQNHGFATDPESLKGADVEFTHVNLNDGTCEGLRLRDGSAFAVQYHPEASPGPHDANYFFRQFAESIERGL